MGKVKGQLAESIKQQVNTHQRTYKDNKAAREWRQLNAIKLSQYVAIAESYMGKPSYARFSYD